VTNTVKTVKHGVVQQKKNNGLLIWTGRLLGAIKTMGLELPKIICDECGRPFLASACIPDHISSSDVMQQAREHGWCSRGLHKGRSLWFCERCVAKYPDIFILKGLKV
jgi:hypothetical protein